MSRKFKGLGLGIGVIMALTFTLPAAGLDTISVRAEVVEINADELLLRVQAEERTLYTGESSVITISLLDSIPITTISELRKGDFILADIEKNSYGSTYLLHRYEKLVSFDRKLTTW